MSPNVVIIACSIFRSELESLQRLGKITVPIVYLNSMLHMHPKELQTVLDKKIRRYQDSRIILLYGDCHPRMLDYEKNPLIVRTPGINCCEILLGSEQYHKLRAEGAFIVLPEWVDRWKESFVDYMGFRNANVAKSFMKDMHRKFVYVDTGLQKINSTCMDELTDYMGLPMEVFSSSTENLESALNRLINQEGGTTNE